MKIVMITFYLVGTAGLVVFFALLASITPLASNAGLLLASAGVGAFGITFGEILRRYP